ncbi:MAG: hypothetical protein MJ252_15455 [archaeon]|nr:hypothetical protein [archaeon]
MDTFDNKVSEMEKEISKIQKNLYSVKRKNNKTMNSIANSINTLSRHNSSKGKKEEKTQTAKIKIQKRLNTEEVSSFTKSQKKDLSSNDKNKEKMNSYGIPNNQNLNNKFNEDEGFNNYSSARQKDNMYMKFKQDYSSPSFNTVKITPEVNFNEKKKKINIRPNETEIATGFNSTENIFNYQQTSPRKYFDECSENTNTSLIKDKYTYFFNKKTNKPKTKSSYNLNFTPHSVNEQSKIVNENSNDKKFYRSPFSASELNGKPSNNYQTITVHKADKNNEGIRHYSCKSSGEDGNKIKVNTNTTPIRAIQKDKDSSYTKNYEKTYEGNSKEPSDFNVGYNQLNTYNNNEYDPPSFNLGYNQKNKPKQKNVYNYNNKYKPKTNQNESNSTFEKPYKYEDIDEYDKSNQFEDIPAYTTRIKNYPNKVEEPLSLRTNTMRTLGIPSGNKYTLGKNPSKNYYTKEREKNNKVERDINNTNINNSINSNPYLTINVNQSKNNSNIKHSHNYSMETNIKNNFNNRNIQSNEPSALNRNIQKLFAQNYKVFENKPSLSDGDILSYVSSLIEENKRLKKFEDEAYDKVSLSLQRNKDEINENDFFNWINYIQSENSKYKLFCDGLMKQYNLHSFEELNNFVQDTFLLCDENDKFMDGIKNILCEEYSRNIGINKGSYNTNTQKKDKRRREEEYSNNDNSYNN